MSDHTWHKWMERAGHVPTIEPFGPGMGEIKITDMTGTS